MYHLSIDLQLNPTNLDLITFLDHATSEEVSQLLQYGYIFKTHGIDQIITHALQMQSKQSIPIACNCNKAHEKELDQLKTHHTYELTKQKQEAELMYMQLSKTQLSHEQTIKMLETTKTRELSHLQSDIDHIKRQKTIEYESLKTSQESRITLYERLLLEKNEEIRSLHSNQMTTVLQQKHETIVKQYESQLLIQSHQIASLKNTNFCKGIIGENLITDMLRSNFPEYTIVDQSGKAQESDIHFINKTDQIIAIESKNKATITLQDVDKSIRDIEHLSTKYGSSFVGYIFFSLETPNIPKKGISFEIINDRPVIWYGTKKNGETFRLEELVLIMKIMINLSITMNRSKISQNDVVLLLQRVFMQITTNKRMVEGVRTAMRSMEEQIEEIQKNNNGIYESLSLYMSDHGITIAITGGNGNCNGNNNKRSCDKCGKTYTSLGSLTKHIKTCTVCPVLS